MSNSDPTRRAPRTEEERILRGRLLGRRVELLDGRSGLLRLVWFDPVTRALSCCVQVEGASAWIDADEILIPPGTGA
jgi:hypothetical protein